MNRHGLPGTLYGFPAVEVETFEVRPDPAAEKRRLDGLNEGRDRTHFVYGGITWYVTAEQLAQLVAGGGQNLEGV